MTNHKIYFKNSGNMKELPDGSVDLVVTSPPYPMIEMWDEEFFGLNGEIKRYFDRGNYLECFKLMHEELNKTWAECRRVLKRGGIACVNIGDATRTLDGEFQLWSNHTMVNKYFVLELGLKPLPIILWRKSSNKPNKFMGSGMLPPNAYVTLEHEYILVFRKGGKREFLSDKDKNARRESAFFWEERNNWFSDVWFGLAGTRQKVNREGESLRARSAAYPLELALRLINMYSVYDDVVLDPFWGTGTTSIAAMLLKRNSVGYEINEDFNNIFKQSLRSLPDISNKLNSERLNKHIDFIDNWKNTPKHKNATYGFVVVTSQERNIKFYDVNKVDCVEGGKVRVKYCEHENTVAGEKAENKPNHKNKEPCAWASG